MKEKKYITYKELEKIADEITEKIGKLIKRNFKSSTHYQTNFDWSFSLTEDLILHYNIIRDGDIFFEDVVYLNLYAIKINDTEYLKEFPEIIADNINKFTAIEELNNLIKSKQTFLKMIEELEERLEAGTISFKKFNENYIEHKKNIEYINNLIEEIEKL